MPRKHRPRVVGALARWVNNLVTSGRFKSHYAVAEAMGVTVNTVQRVGAQGTFRLENLLRLAEAANERPSIVLRLGGKLDEAALLERLYGVGDLTPREQHLLGVFRQLDAADQTAIVTLEERLARNPSGEQRKQPA